MIEIDYFSASWCGPCKKLVPIVSELRDQGFKVNKYDIDEYQELASKNRVMAVPTMIFKKDGQEVNRMIGAKDRQTIMLHIKKAMQ